MQVERLYNMNNNQMSISSKGHLMFKKLTAIKIERFYYIANNLNHKIDYP